MKATFGMEKHWIHDLLRVGSGILKGGEGVIHIQSIFTHILLHFHGGWAHWILLKGGVK